MTKKEKLEALSNDELLGEDAIDELRAEEIERRLQQQ
jgi:hypothetical protein